MSENQVTVPPILQNILVEFTVSVLEEKPQDLISYAANYFTRLRDSRNDDSIEGLAGEKTVICSHLGARADRRKSVVGEKYDPEDGEDQEEVEKYHKSDNERKRIKERTKDIFLFKNLGEEDIDELVDAMLSVSVKEGQIVIRQDDDGDFFYVVDEGTFEASIKNGNGEEKLVEIYDNSGSFGELALLHNQPRAATVKATTDGQLWAVSRQTFKRLVAKRKFDKMQNYITLLDKVPELEALSKYEKMQVCDALKPVVFHKDDVLFEEGDEGDGMYFVEEGIISIVQRSTKSIGYKEVAELGPGDYFGEMALVKNQPRAATAKAVTDVKLAFLEVKAFERLLGPCLEIMKRRMDTYKHA